MGVGRGQTFVPHKTQGQGLGADTINERIMVNKWTLSAVPNATKEKY